MARNKRRGTRWRLEADDAVRNPFTIESNGTIAVDSFSLDPWLYVEAFGVGTWSVQVGDLVLSVTERKDGTVRVVVVDDNRKELGTKR